MHCTDRVTLAAYRCIEEDNFGCKLQALPDLLIAFWSVGTRCSLSSPVCLQCNCSILSLPLYMFVVAVLTTLPSLCSAMFSLLRALLLSSSTPLAIDLISVLQRSYGGKSSPWRISRHLLCLLFCVREIVRDSPIVNIVSQTWINTSALMNTPWMCALVMLHCLVRKNAPWRQTTAWGHGGHHRIYTSKSTIHARSTQCVPFLI